jgi:hypothetical protein
VTGATTDDHQQRSEIVEASLLAQGVDLILLEGVRWTPTHLVFIDSITGEVEDLSVSSYAVEGSHLVRIFLSTRSVRKRRGPVEGSQLRRSGKIYGNVEARGRHLYFTILEGAPGFQITVIKTPGTTREALGSHPNLEEAKEECDAYAKNYLAGGVRVPPITWY